MCLYGLCQSCLILGHRPKDSSSRQGNRTVLTCGSWISPRKLAHPTGGRKLVVGSQFCDSLQAHVEFNIQSHSTVTRHNHSSVQLQKAGPQQHKCENQLPKFIFLLSSLHSFIYVCTMGSAGNTLQEKVKCQPVSSRQDWRMDSAQQRHCDEPLPLSGVGRLVWGPGWPHTAENWRWHASRFVYRFAQEKHGWRAMLFAPCLVGCSGQLRPP